MSLNMCKIIIIIQLVLPSWQQDNSDDINVLLKKLIEKTNNATGLNNKHEESDDDSKIIIIKTFQQEPIANNKSQDQSDNNRTVLDEENLITRRNFNGDQNINKPGDDDNILQEIIIEVEKMHDSEHTNEEDKTKKLMGEFLSETGRSALNENIHTKKPHILSGDDILHSISSANVMDLNEESKTGEIDSISSNRLNFPQVINDYVSNNDVIPFDPPNHYHKDIPRENFNLPIKKNIEKILLNNLLRTEYPISRQGNVRYVPPQNPKPLSVVKNPYFRIMGGPLSDNSVLPIQTQNTLPNRHIHYPINHFRLPYMGTNLQPSTWGNDYALQNVLMRTSSLHNLKHFNYLTDLTNKMMSRVVYQPLFTRFL